ncbi:hypothetical protein GCM10028818_56020 [Spirosoma horti]
MQKTATKHIRQLALFSTFLVITLSCMTQDHAGVSPQTGQGTLIDHGSIPVPVEGHSEFAENEFQTATYQNHFVFVATSDGLWKNNLLTKEWSRSGLKGKRVSCIFRHPTIENKLFAGIKPDEHSPEKTLFISNDGGATWQAAQSPVYDELENRYEIYVSLAVRPNHPDQIYANIGGTMIAVSTDGGLNWQRMNHEQHSDLGYRSAIVFLPNNADQIFQGSENPFDDAWLGRYDIDPSDPVKLKNFTKVVDMGVFGNRRPVELQTHAYTGNSIYVGQEGALAKVSGTTPQFIFKAEEANPAVPYTYIYGIWVDPKDTHHILFGGALNAESQPSLSLFETFDEGKDSKPVTADPTLATAEVSKIVPTDTYPAIVLYDPTTKRIRLFLYKSA